MNIALKEWASVQNALAQGIQILTLRKGGIVEAHRGGIEIRHREFLLFPTFEHQHSELVKPAYRDLVHPPSGQEIQIDLLARITDIFPAPPTLEAAASLDAFHIWNPRFLEIRYSYRPDLPLWLLLIRAFRLPSPGVRIPDRPAYAGCKSWVNLTEDQTGPLTRLEPVLTDAEYSSTRQRVLDALPSAK